MIRAGNINDLSAIEGFSRFRGSRREEIDDGRIHVVEVNGAIAGFIVESKKGLLGRPYVEYLAVKEEYRRQKIASRLLEHMESRHLSNRLFISTESTNTPMLNLLKSKRYKKSGAISKANLSGADEIYFFKEIA